MSYNLYFPRIAALMGSRPSFPATPVLTPLSSPSLRDVAAHLRGLPLPVPMSPQWRETAFATTDFSEETVWNGSAPRRLRSRRSGQRRPRR